MKKKYSWKPVRKEISSEISDQVWWDFRWQVRDQTWYQIREQLWYRVNDQVRRPVRRQVWGLIKEKLNEEV